MHRLDLNYLSNKRQLTVEWGHCDPQGYVFNSQYYMYFDWSTALLFHAALGLTKPQMQAIFNVDIPLVQASAQVHKPARYFDVVEIVSTIGEFGRSSFNVKHRLFNHGELAVEGEERRVWVGRDPHDASRMLSKQIPSEVIERFAVPA